MRLSVRSSLKKKGVVSNDPHVPEGSDVGDEMAEQSLRKPFKEYRDQYRKQIWRRPFILSV